MAIREIDVLDEAVAGTERELFQEAFGKDGDDDAAEGDRSLEEMRPGLGEDLDEDIDEDAKDDAEVKADDSKEPKEEAEAEDGDKERDEKGRFKAKAGDEEETEEQPQQAGRVPAARLREESDKRRAAEARVESGQREFRALSDKLDLALRQIDDLRRTSPRPEPKQEVQNEPPDIFTDPKGYADWVDARADRRVTAAEGAFSERLIGMSLAAAHERHGEKFETAYNAVIDAARTSQEGRAVVQRIWASENPGGELMRWHSNRETLREVGGDPAAYREKIAKETREALMADPEFRKQLVAELRSGTATDGHAPKTIARLPKSLNGASRGPAQATDARTLDDSERGIFQSAYSD